MLLLLALLHVGAVSTYLKFERERGERERERERERREREREREKTKGESGDWNWSRIPFLVRSPVPFHLLRRSSAQYPYEGR